MIHNAEISQLFTRLADLLEIEGANPFRVRAYRNTARVIDNLPNNVAEMVKEGADLTEIPSVGKDIAEKIKTIVRTGKFPLLEQIEKRTPKVLSELMKVSGLGPKRVLAIYTQLNVRSFPELKAAIKSGKLHELRGFGEKIEQKIKESLLHLSTYTNRILLIDAITIAKPLLSYLEKIPGVKKVTVAGSYRRRLETVGDLDIVVVAHNGKEIINKFVQYEEVTTILAQGSTRASVRLHSNVQVDLRVVAQVSSGAALLYFTGSKAHSIALRKRAIQKKLKINEYGLFKNNKRIAGKTEQEMYEKLGLPYIEPELREDRGEIAAAEKGKLPKLVSLTDIRGDLHCHTKATDGTASIMEMVQAAQERGYEYLAITDHSQHLTVANGLSEKEFLAQIKLIDQLNEKLNNFIILKSVELDILEDGTLDFSDDILKEVDVTICSIHSQFGLSEKKQTERVIRAMDNPYFNIFSHPTGRLIGKRAPYAIDLERIMRAAKNRGCFFELDSQPERLDLNDVHCQLAKELQLKIVISSDAHSIQQLDYMQLGIYQARRGWLSPNDVLNTRTLSEFKKMLIRQ